MNKKILTLAIIGTLGAGAFTMPKAVFADEVDTKIQEQDAKLKELNGKKENVKSELSKVVTDIEASEAKLDDLLDEMEKTQKELEVLGREVEVLTDNIEKREVQLQKQARAIQVSGDSQNYIDFILSSESLADVVSRIDSVTKIVSANQDMVTEQKEDKAEVLVKQSKVEEKSKAQVANFANYETAKVELEKQKLEKEIVVAQIGADEATVQSEKDKFLAQKAAAQKAAEEVAAKAALAAADTTPAPASASAQETPVISEPIVETPGEVDPTPAPPVGGGGANVGDVGNRYAYGYCTWYVYERRQQVGNPVGSFWGNANQWAASASAAGLVVSSQPIAGAVLQSNEGGWGHVAFVESVNPDGSLAISEMNYAGGWGLVSHRTVSAGEARSYSYIY